MQVIYQNFPISTYLADRNSFGERNLAIMQAMTSAFPEVKNILSNSKTLLDAAHCSKGYYQFNQDLTFVITKVEKWSSSLVPN